LADVTFGGITRAPTGNPDVTFVQGETLPSADVVFEGRVSSPSALNRDVQLIPGDASPQAEVVIEGKEYAQSALNRNVQIVVSVDSQAEVQNFGVLAVNRDGLDMYGREVKIYQQAEPVPDATFDFGVGAPTPWSIDPDVIQFVCFPTGPSEVAPAQPDRSTLNRIYLANAANVVAGLPGNPYLTGIGKSPTGSLIGADVIGLGPTGGGTTGLALTPLTRYRGKITSYTDNTIMVSPTMPGLPTCIDQIYIDIDRVARNSPRIEIILS